MKFGAKFHEIVDEINGLRVAAGLPKKRYAGTSAQAARIILGQAERGFFAEGIRTPAPAAVDAIDMTPTWAAVLPILIAALENGDAAGRAAARTELARMAGAADKHNAAARAA